jgi:hypothetical protein
MATVGVATAQQIMVKPARGGPVSGPTPTPGNTEFIPEANTSPDPKSLDVPAELQRKASEYVRKLGSAVYGDRVMASRELAAMGRFALPALLEAVRTSDEPEVVERAEALLPKAQALDMKARVGCFLADKDGKFDHTLPGWALFKDTAGNSPASRELFAEALKNKVTHQMLLAAEHNNAEEASAVLSAYIARLQGYYNRWGGNYEQPTPPKTADLLIALFLEAQYSDKEVVITMPGWGWGGGQYFTVATNVHSSVDFQNVLYKRAGKFNEPIKKVLQKWMDTRETAGGCNQAWSLAQSLLGQKPALKYAARVLRAESIQNTQWMKQNILMHFGSHGAKEYLMDITKCFEDSLTIWHGGQGNTPNFDIQIRDYALAIALQMTDQKPKDYGFESTHSGTAKNWNYNAFYFKDDRDEKERGVAGGGRVIVRGVKPPVEDPMKDEKKDDKKDDKAKKLTQDDRRQAAFKKWAEWQAANMKDGKLIEKPKTDGKKDEPKKDGQSAEDTAKEAAKKEQLKKEEAIKKEEAKKDEQPADAKKEEPKKEEPKKEEKKDERK